MDGLAYEEDSRKSPNAHRRDRFRRGWRDAVAGDTDYSQVLHKLTWWNLGFRLGRLFGETEEDQIFELYEWAATQWRTTQGAENDH